MDLNQSFQTFLILIVVFLILLVGLFFLFKQNKQEKLSLAGAVQTSILVVGFLSLIVFGGSYYFVLSDVDPSKQPLKDALSIAASFFGGFATLTAAYIASKMFNDWKDEHNKSVDKEIVFGVISNLNSFLLETQHFHNSISQVVDLSELRQFNLSDDEFTETIKYLRQIIRQHENAIANVTNNYSDLESVMSEYTYEVFATHFQIVIDSLLKVHKSFINDINSLLAQHKTDPKLIKFYFKKFREILDVVNTYENGVIVRVKAIKKELSKFYRA